MFSALRHTYFLQIFKRNCSNNFDTSKYPRQIFSAIQPTGDVHIGNYLGAIKKWVELQNTETNVIYSIADLHSLSQPQDPNVLYRNIHLMAATLLGCGIDPNKSIFFKQSDVHEHSELYWILGTMGTMAKLSHLPQYKEKTDTLKEIPVGIFMYPVLQAADIALYKTTHVPVGQDQMPHIMLTNHLLKCFNRHFGSTFPKVTPIIGEDSGSIRSLIQPDKKMSKSGLPKSCINLIDTPEDILLKCKKAISDFNSKLTYDPINRPGISNLILIHSELTNQLPNKICRDFEHLNTGQYKLVLADVIIETLKPICQEIHRYLKSPEYINNILSSGAEKASEIAEQTVKEVKSKIGIHREIGSLQKLKQGAN